MSIRKLSLEVMMAASVVFLVVFISTVMINATDHMSFVMS
jgi:hypothetical protein